jgi:hypothetical protein
MEWPVEYTDAFGVWWDHLTGEEQEDINAVVILLQRFGSALCFPYSSSVVSSRHAHMCELRVQHAGRPYRILYAFDPRRAAIMLSAARRPGTIGGMRPLSPWRTGCTTNIWPSSDRKVNAPMAKNVKDLQAKMSPESRARSEAKAERLIREMALDELRAARALTQEHLSTILGVKQSAISKLERRADMYVSTLRHVIEAMGGQLEIRAVFPDGDVRITQFQTLAEPKGEGDSNPS